MWLFMRTKFLIVAVVLVCMMTTAFFVAKTRAAREVQEFKQLKLGMSELEVLESLGGWKPATSGSGVEVDFYRLSDGSSVKVFYISGKLIEVRHREVVLFAEEQSGTGRIHEGKATVRPPAE